MKRVFVIAFILVSCFNKSVAQVESFFSNDSVVTKIDIPLQGATMPSKGGTKHIPMLVPVTASITGEILMVNFTSSTPSATITITDQFTGEVIYSDFCNLSSITINLGLYGAETGETYVIDIFTDSWEREGTFEYNNTY